VSLPLLFHMKLIALSQLTGVYGRVEAGEEFEVDDSIATELLRLGYVRPAVPPPVVYETKVITPQASTVGARPPFRHVPVPDSQPEELVTAGDPVLREPELLRPGTVDPGRRRGRARSSPDE
jgi:hypothetical protein